MRKLILLVLLFNATISMGQKDSDSTKVKKDRKVKVLPVPAFGYSPETRGYIGAVALFTLDLYKDSLTRTSNAKIEFNYTQNRQSILEAQWNYFFREEKWFTDGKFHLSRYPDQYFGIGAFAPDSNAIFFNSDRLITKIDVLKRVRPHLFAGIGLEYIKFKDVSGDDIALFEELSDQENFEISGDVIYDSRNNLLNATSGRYANVSLGYNSGTNEYLKTRIDLRAYKTWKDKYTIAARLYNEFTSNTPNFYDNARMGGDLNARGYFFGRFRDRNLSTLQVEGRIDLFWRLDLAVFGGVSSVYAAFDALDQSRLAPNYGFGIRFLTDKTEKVNLRFDYALGLDGSSGFYVSFGEAF
jgi:outer membrane protein assembly factor BamA